MTYSLLTIATADGPVLALEASAQRYRLTDLLPDLAVDPAHGLLEVFQQWPDLQPRIDAAYERLADHSPRPEDATAQVLLPISYPPKIICAGTNYYDHLRIDFNTPDFDKTAYDILYFMRHAKALVGPGKTVRYPSQSLQLDWEVELVVVFGKGGRRVSPEDALDMIAGYTVGLDLSARDLQFNPRHRKKFDVFAGKSFDDSSPMGPGIVPARFVDPTDLSLKLWVNGQIRQDSHTREMIWSLAEQIAELSQHMTIEAGDVLYTGSPAGIGMVSGTFLKVGDIVEAEVQGLGTLAVEIMPDPDADRARIFCPPRP